MARDCAKAGERHLFALVVLAGSRLPGRLNGAVVDPDDRRVLVAWQAELVRIPLIVAIWRVSEAGHELLTLQGRPTCHQLLTSRTLVSVEDVGTRH